MTLPLLLPIILTAETAISIADERPRIPVINCSGLRSDKFLSANDKIPMAIAILFINEPNAYILTGPLKRSNFSIIANAPINSANRTPIPTNPPAIAVKSIEETSNKDPANNAIAPAILIKVLAFKSFWYASSASLALISTSFTCFPNPLNDPIIPLAVSATSATSPVIFFTCLTISTAEPALIKSKMVPKSIVPITSAKLSIIGSRNFLISLKPLIIAPKKLLKSKLAKYPIKVEILVFRLNKKLATLSNAFLILEEIVSKNPISLADCRRSVKNCPILAPASNKFVPIPSNNLPIGEIPLINALIVSPTNGIISNNPLNVVLILSAVSSLILNFSVKSLNLFVKSINFIEVIGGNTSSQAPLIELNTFPNP